jgi:hypothetical protein
MLLPPLLIVGSEPDDVGALTALLVRIGLANPVRVSTTLGDATQFLATSATSRLPVVVLAFVPGAGAAGVALLEWMRAQPDAIVGIDTVALIDASDVQTLAWAEASGVLVTTTPVEMRSLISALKSFKLPEKARIDPATLMVQVELWPRTADVVSRP